MSLSNPYPGLLPFQDRDAALFFGRDREIDEVLGRLAYRRLLAVIGVSGCGKTSLVRAGVVPILRVSAPPSLHNRWRISTLNPANSPLESLSMAVGAPAGWPRNTFDLTDFARQMLDRDEALLLVIDQFEELFRFRKATLGEDAGNAASLFVNVVLDAVHQREVPVYVVLTMRTDFLGECANFRGLPEALNDCYYLVPRMTRLQQQEAIEKPLLRQGQTMHQALTQQLLNDSADDPDHLPVLQHLLRRLWESWNARKVNQPIGLQDYEAVGAWANALDRDAESVMALFEDFEDGVRRLFQWITELGPAEQPVRRPRSFSECVEASGLPPALLTNIISAFQARGLLHYSGEGDQRLLDLPHESVALHWNRLRGWIVEGAESGMQSRFFLQAARQHMPLTELALETGLRLRSSWHEHRLSALRYLSPSEVDEAMEWIGKSEELEKNRRNVAEARELCAWAALSLGDDAERSLILGLHAWAKQRSMVSGLEEFLHLAVQRSSSRLSLTHGGSVWDVAWSPDDTKVATAVSDGTVTVWTFDAGTEDVKLSGHRGSVVSVVWSPDGAKLASAGSDGTVIVWDMHSAADRRTLCQHEFAVLHVDWSPDGTCIGSASDDNSAKVWDANTGREMLSLEGHSGAVWCIRWSPDGRTIVTASRDMTVKFFNAADGRELLTLRGHQAVVKTVAWSSDGSKVATGSFDHTVKVWDARTGFELITIRGHLGPVIDVTWLAADNKLVTCSSDNTARIWDADTGREIATLRGYEAAVLTVASSHDGRFIATGTDDGLAKIAEIGTSRELLAFRAHEVPAWQIRWSPDGTKLATGSDESSVKIWDSTTGLRAATINREGTHVEGLAWSPDSTKIATSRGPSAAVCDVSTGLEVLVIGGHEEYVGAIEWSPEGDKIATGSRDGVVKVTDCSTAEELVRLQAHQGEVRSIAWSPDGNTLASGSNDGTVNIMSAEAGNVLAVLRHPDAVSSLSWSTDGATIVTANRDHRARVWDVYTGAEIVSCVGHTAAVQSVAWAPDGSTFATGGLDYTVRIWTRDGRELLTLRSEFAVQSVAWSPDGAKLASIGLDGMVAVYVIDTTLLLRLVRRRITRNLTVEECRRYLAVDVCPPLPEVC
jgi:WD40 repeat protein